VPYQANALNERLKYSYLPFRGCQCRSCGGETTSMPASDCCPIHRPPGAVSDVLPGANESLPPCFVPTDSTLDGEVSGASENPNDANSFWVSGIWPDACASTSSSSLLGGGVCLHASLDLVQSGLKNSPDTCLDTSQIAPGGPTRRLYVLGDSHAAMLVPGVKAAFQRSFTVVHTTCVGSGCGFNPDSFFARLPDPMHEPWGHRATYCSLMVQEAWAKLNQTVQAGDVVMAVTASFRYYWNWPGRESGVADQVAFLTQLNNEVLAPRGASLVVTDDVPYLQGRGTDCVLDPTPCETDPTQILRIPSHDSPSHETYYLRGSSQSRNDMLVPPLTAFAASYPNVYFMQELYAPFCVGGTCHVVIPGTSTVGYYDDDHVNTAGALYLAPFMNCFFYSVGLIDMYG